MVNLVEARSKKYIYRVYAGNIDILKKLFVNLPRRRVKTWLATLHTACHQQGLFPSEVEGVGTTLLPVPCRELVELDLNISLPEYNQRFLRARARLPGCALNMPSSPRTFFLP